MIGWRAKLHRAKFRGVGMEVESVTLTGNQRIAEHEYPGMDGTYSESLGRGAREWSVVGFIIGKDYMLDRDSLCEALDKPDPAEYTDPFFATPITVVCPQYTCSEGRTEGMGWARFALTLREHTDPRAVQALSLAAAIAKATNALDKMATENMRKYTTIPDNPTGLTPGAMIDAVGGTISLMTEAIFGPMAALIDNVAKIADVLSDLDQDLYALAQMPATLGSRMEAAFEQFEHLGTVDKFTQDNPPPVVLPYAGGTPKEVEANTAAAETNRMTFACAVQRQGTLLLSNEWASADEALAALKRWSDIMLSAAATESGDLYAALTDCRGAVAQAVELIASGLPRMIQVTIGAPMTTLQIAQRYYGDYTRATEIAAMNGIICPAFVSGTITLLSE